MPEHRRAAFVEALRAEVAARYPSLDDNPDYTRILNEAQFRRLRGYLDEVRARGGETIALAPVDPARAEAERILPPTVVLDPADDLALMREEIFGPILPVKAYRDIDQAIAFVNGHDRPLALYHFDHDRARTERVLSRTLAGGVTVNDTVMRIAQPSLPFGGIGPSGMGHYHSRAGFLTFSKQMPVFHQARYSGMTLFKPPYRGLADRLVRWLTR